MQFCAELFKINSLLLFIHKNAFCVKKKFSTAVEISSQPEICTKIEKKKDISLYLLGDLMTKVNKSEGKLPRLGGVKIYEHFLTAVIICHLLSITGT